jgi:NO-binding membrane sensor protein with MHYT domain/signal transduction histidine kinase
MDLAETMPWFYDPKLVLLSIIVPSLAAYAALAIVERIRAGNKMISENAWLAVGALTMGIGVWAMHFIAMLAFQLPVPVNYDIWVTAASMLPVVLASRVALYVISRTTCTWRQLIVGGVLMGSGIGMMHYTGMAAMRMDALMRFDPLIFSLSIIVAVVLSVVALYVNWFASQKSTGSEFIWFEIGAALVMGFAVSGMHYTGMSAAYFFIGSTTTGIDINAMDTNVLGVLVALASIMITAITIGMTILEKRMVSAAGTASVSRSQLIEAIESISDGFALFDTQQRLALMNSKYLELMQLGSRESVMGASFESIMRKIANKAVFKESQQDPDAWVEQLLQNWKPEKPSIQELFDGRWLRINERSIKDIGVVAIYTDITEIKSAQLRLVKANDEITALNERLHDKVEKAILQKNYVESQAEIRRYQAISQMVAGVSHEINTPISIAFQGATFISDGLTQMATSGLAMNDEAKEELNDILDASELIKTNILRADKLISSFKNLSVGQFIDTLEQVDLQELMGELIALYPAQSKGPKLTIEVDNRLEGDSQWLGYPGLLTQILLNLINNAQIHAYGEGSPGIVKIILTTKMDDFIIQIQDFGCGISKECIEQVFTAFYTTRRGQGGTGLGMAIVHNLVTSELQGSINLKSTLAEGTTVTLVFPKQLKA